MSVYNFESLRKEFSNTWMGDIKSTTEQLLWDAELVNSRLFTRTSYTNDTIDDSWELTNLYPAPYRAWLGSTAVDNTPTHILTTSLKTPVKALARSLDPERLRWMMQGSSLSAIQLNSILSDGRAIINKLTMQSELRNEKECWDLLTTGTLTTLDNQTFQVPIFGVANSGGVLCHDRTDWFTSGGAVNTSADMAGDLLQYVQYMSANGFDTPTTIWMNSVTFSAILGNTKLSNTGGDQWWKPLGTVNLTGDLINWRDRNKIKLVGAAFTPYMLKIIINDSFYSGLTGSQTKFLPDYYVVLTADKVGTRYVTPNPYDWSAERWVRNYPTLPNVIPATLTFEVGENSMCYPDNRGNMVSSGSTYVNQWKSHYVAYVKSA